MRHQELSQNEKSERRIKNNRLRRQRQLRRNITMIMFSFILILSLSVGAFSIGSKAQDKNEIVLYKYYTNIVVQYDEDLDDIAEKYFCEEKYSSHDDYIFEVLRINRMYDEKVTPGTYLTVPYFSPEFK